MRAALSISVLLLLTACARGPTAFDQQYAAKQQAIAEKTTRAEAGDVVAERELGELYTTTGEGVVRDPVKAAAWMTKAADSGDAQAQFELARFYTQGYGVTQDSNQAQALLMKAAMQGLPKAESAVGYDFLHGVGTPVDYAQALTWLHKADADGDAMADTNLGYMSAYGMDVARDDAAAMQWYMKAADRGNRDAQLFVAETYRDGGHGVQPDPVVSGRYYAMVAQNTVHTQAELSAVMKAIVASHKSYPKEAVAAKQAGVATVEFDCADQKAQNVKITKSSGFPLLDAAARQAVLDSAFPDRSTALYAYSHFVIMVNFELGPEPAPPAATK